MKPTHALLAALLLAPFATLHADDGITIDLTKRTWQGIPGLERTAKGRVFASWFTGGPKEPSPDNTVVLSRSDDGGKTFRVPEAMALPRSDGTRCFDPTLWIDPKRRLWYIFNRGNKDTAKHDVWARICDDPDASPPVWGAEFRVGYDVPFAFRMNKITVLSTGEWLMPVTLAEKPVHEWCTGYNDKQEPTLHGIGISTDEGRTWKLHGAVKARPWALENMIVELKDGRLWMLIRTDSGVLWQSHSADKGRTWSEGTASTIKSPGSRFFIRRLASGNLLLVNHHKFTGRSHLTAQVSTDDGATWNDGLLLDERGGVSYPDGVQDKDGVIWITYDRDRNGTGEILLAKFREEDVAAGKNVSGAVTLKQVINKIDKPASLVAVGAAEFHIATNGDDKNPGTPEKPFATLERARDAVRASRSGKPYAEAALEARVVVHGGTHRLAKTLVLEPVDSGLVIVGAPGKRVVLSGGRVVTGWEAVREGVVKADVSNLGLPDLKFREIYCDGQRQHWARVPDFDPKNPRRGGFLRNAGLVEPGTKTKFRYREGELDPARWKQPAGAWVVFHDSLNYRQTWSPLKPESLDPATRTFAVNSGDYVLSATSPYYLCGLLEELDAPGEWCVDQQAKTLNFMPPAGKVEGREIVVPALDTIISFQGDANTGGAVTNVRLSGLLLTECRQEAVLMKGATRCEVTACELRNVGTAVHLGDDTHRCRVAGCDVTQTLRDGISVKGTSTDHSRVSDHVIVNNYIWDFGWGDIHNRCGGVFLWRCSGIKVTHNHIHDGPRYAIGTDVGNDFEIAWNRCHHVNLTTSDTSIIEGGTAGDWSLPDDEELRRNREHNWGNRVHHNLCYDSGGWSAHGGGTWAFPDYSWGIYLDLSNSGWHVHDNIVYDTVLGGFMQNAGLENRVENNIFIGGKKSQVRFNNWAGYLMSGHRCERNIISYQGRSASLYEAANVLPQHCRYASNLIHCQSGLPRVKGVALNEATDSWSAWQALGQDAGSVLADPLFVDAAKHDYRLKPGSPALKLGFQPLDLSPAGNYASAERRTWPRPEEPVVRPAADYTEPATNHEQPVLRDYEDYELGEPERFVGSGPRDGRGIVGVTDETAASGRHSLRFGQTAVDPAKPVMSPFLAYPCAVETGRLKTSLALRRAPDSPFTCESRNAPYTYQRGPSFAVDAKGQLSAAGKVLLTIPANEWVRIETECTLGKDNPGTFQLTVTLPNAAPQVFPSLPLDPKFKTLEILVLQLAGTEPATCWLDDLRFETSER